MLTIHEHKVISKVFSILCATYFIPLDWNELENKLLFTKSKIKLVVSHFICIWQLIFLLHVGFSFFQLQFGLHYCGNGSRGQMVFQVGGFASYSLFSIHYITLLLYGKESCNLFNELSHFNHEQGYNKNITTIVT